MAIATQSATYVKQGPSYTGQSLQPNKHSNLETALLGYATFTGDGSTTTATLNYIDGTQALNSTPTLIFAAVVGGDDTAGALVQKVVDAANANKTATVTFTAAPASAKTVEIAFFIVL